MKNALLHLAEESAQTAQIIPQVQATRKFSGSDNPRHLRALHGLLRRPMPREQLDREAGCSNGPELVAELRRRGLAIPCARVAAFDRDGREVKRGVYHLTANDRRKLHYWFSWRRRA
jgi:hypothetical protein